MRISLGSDRQSRKKGERKKIEIFYLLVPSRIKIFALKRDAEEEKFHFFPAYPPNNHFVDPEGKWENFLRQGDLFFPGPCRIWHRFANLL